MKQVGEPLEGGRKLAQDSILDLRSCISSIADGNRAALSALYYEFAGLTFSIAKRIVGSKENAQEIVCDVFLHVWQHAHSFDATRGSVRAWLSVITRHRSIDLWRRNRKFHPAEENEMPPHSRVDASHPEGMLSAFQRGSAVYSALATLSPLRRHLVGLAFFEDLTHEEIAASTKLPLGTVKSHVRRALKSMRGALEMKPRKVAAGSLASSLAVRLRPDRTTAPGNLPILQATALAATPLVS